MKELDRKISDNTIHKETFFNVRPDILACLFLVIATLAVYYRKALHYNPNMTQALYALAWLFASHENREFRNGAEAIKLGERLCKITRYEQPLTLDVLAAAYAEAGEFDNAVSTAQKALELALPHGPEKLTSGLKRRLHVYETGSPYHQQVEKNRS
jgi:tetratricopeptide (TPR) repeat protein